MSLMASPKAKGLFHKAIIQSSYTLPDTPLERALEKGIAVAEHLGVPDATAETLRAIPAEAFWPLASRLKLLPRRLPETASYPCQRWTFFQRNAASDAGYCGVEQR
jgi:carboxylesterase type B